MRLRSLLSLAGVGLWCSVGVAASVTVHQKMRLGEGEVSHLLTSFASTEEVFTSLQPYEVEGWQFVGWEIEPVALAPNARYPWGQCVERVRFVPKDAVVTLTARYEKSDADSDNDGLPDATEWRYFGTLEHDGASDVDKDGLTFTEELAIGTHPGLVNRLVGGGVTSVAGGESVHNIYFETGFGGKIIQVTFRSEPEGRLFPTTSQVITNNRNGNIYSPTLASPFMTSSPTFPFAYWTVRKRRSVYNEETGQYESEICEERLTDAFGRALPRVTEIPAWDDLPKDPEIGIGLMECVAHCIDDSVERLQAYYGESFQGADSDEDDDGRTAQVEWEEGTHPAMKDALIAGGITRVALEPVLYASEEQVASYTLRSEPDGLLFATQTGEQLLPGETVQTPKCTPRGTTFAYWTVNGVRQADDWGVALDELTVTLAAGATEIVAHTEADEFTRFSLYWFGDTTRSAEDDSDGDGIPLAEEIRLRLNPRLRNTLVKGGVAIAEGNLGEVNLQGFDQQTSVLVKDGPSGQEALFSLFASLDAETGELTGGYDFTSAVSPLALDVNGDGLFDLLVSTATGMRLALNTGSAGNPNFAMPTEAYPNLHARLATMTRRNLCGALVAGKATIWASDDGGTIVAYDVATDTLQATTATGFPLWSKETGLVALRKEGDCVQLADGYVLPLDVIPESITSAALAEATGDGLADLLVADALGRISLYERVGDGFELRHRVWGGSFEGFAKGLTLAPVDWDGDGDLDMLCGTAEGKLLLLSDPKVGKPSNLRAAAGIDNVLLAWDPNGQSRVCGYNVYRAAATDFARLGETPLPSYRDQNLSPAEWAYRVTALSRRWVAGNSEPKVFESDPSDIVKATVGNVTLSLPASVTVYAGQQVVVPLSVNNAQGVTGAMSFTFTYDAAYDAAALAPVSFAPSALAQELSFESAVTNGTWTLTTSGTLAAGAGELLRLRFRALALSEGKQRESKVTLTEAKLGSITATLEGDATTVTVKDAPKPPRLTLKAEDVEAPLGTDEVTLPLTLAHVSTSGAMDWATLTVSADFDPALLALVSAPDIHGAAIHDYRFKVLTRTNEAQVAEVTFSAAAKGTNGLAAEVSPTTARVVIAPKASTAGTPSLILLKVVGAEGDGLIRDDDDDEDEFDVKIGGTVIVKVRATAKGTETFDWERFSLSAAWKPKGGVEMLRTEHLRTEGNGTTAFYAVTFKVLEPVYKGDRHDDDDDDWDDRWEDDIDIVFTGAVADAPDIKVKEAECEFEIEGRLDPRRVPPWHAGDLDGDGYLTGNDYQIARNHMKAYHQTGNAKKDKPHDSDEARKVHASLLMVPGITDPLTLKDVTVTYKKYLCNVCGVPPGELNMGNKGGKQ